MRTWALLLAGPVIWFAHFMFVYLAVEIGCAAEIGHTPLLLGLSGLALLTLATTVVAAASSLALGLLAYRPRRRGAAAGEADAGLALASLVLGATFAAAILLVGVPALWVEPC